VVEDLFRNLIAIAAGSFEAGAIENRNLAAVILNKSGLLQFIRSHRDSGSTGAQHLGKSIVCQMKALRVNLQTADKQPTTQAFIYGVEVIANT
jgi:hypothetical protein